jgi:Tol biopolymer transport system component
MGEVYRARDTKLGRDVALKVLPEEFTADPDRLARFEREAKVLASLNHAHIAHIYGLEEADGQKALVLELVEGSTLAARIARGPVPVDEAIPLFRQIAQGLEAAHERGIVHRDLKPGNVKIALDGTVKILDFGLARESAVDPSQEEVSRSPTLTRDATEAGVILGTAPYMSPEQARGQVVDRRTDIWAFGACLHEALTGQRAFDGESVADVLGAIVQKDPDGALPSSTPRRVRELVEKCLRKDRSRRLQHIGDARLELEDVTAGEEPDPGAPQASVRLPRLASGLAAGLAIGAALMWLIQGRLASRDVPAPGLVQLTAKPPENTVLSAALSADGKYLAFADLGGLNIQVTATGEEHSVPLPNGLVVDEVDWFPDGATLLLASSTSALWKTSIFGVAPRKLAEKAFRAVVSPDGKRVAYLSAAQAPSRQVYVMGVEGEDPRPLARGVGGESFWELGWSPDGEWLLVGAWKMVGAEKRTSIEALRLATGERHTVLSDPRLWQNWRAVLPFIWTPGGRLVYARHEPPPGIRSSNLWSVAIDAAGTVRGEPSRVTQLPGVNFRDLSQAGDGSIAFLAERNQSDVYLADLTGSVDAARSLTSDERDDYPGSWTPHGRTLVLLSDRGGSVRAFRMDLDSGTSLSLSSQADEVELAAVSWDGTSVLHRSSEKWFRTPIEGGPGELLLTSGEELHCAFPARRCVLGERDEGAAEYVFFELDPQGGKGPERARISDNPPFTNWDLSPDGERVAIVHLDGRIRLLELDSGSERVLEDQAWWFGEFVSFAAEGGSLFVDGSRLGRPATRQSLLRVSFGSKTTVEELRYRRNVWHVLPKASPDGQHLAFGAMMFTANAWMLSGVR